MRKGGCGCGLAVPRLIGGSGRGGLMDIIGKASLAGNIAELASMVGGGTPLVGGSVPLVGGTPLVASGAGLPAITSTCNGSCTTQMGGSRSRKTCRNRRPRTARDAATLKKYKAGKSIGFTATSSLKAKGLIPRTSAKNRGKCVVSNKYK